MRFLLFLLTAVALLSCADMVAGGAEMKTIRVMSFNLWYGGDAGKQPLERTAEVIRAAQADVVGLQETHGIAQQGQPRPDNGARLAKILGWHYFDQNGRTGILSRFKIVGNTPRKWGAKIEISAGQPIYLFNAHFKAAPYQPYQLLKIPYGNAPFLQTAAEAEKAARETHGGEVESLLSDVAAVRAEGVPKFLTGDFNEPSHQDWTVAAAQAGKCPLVVAWPSTKAVTDAGFRDGYRAVHPDEVTRRGNTWTPTTLPTDPKDRHDRIDFVFVSTGLAIKSAEVVGESPDFADIVVAKYPSDHRAVVVTIELSTTQR